MDADSASKRLLWLHLTTVYTSHPLQWLMGTTDTLPRSPDRMKRARWYLIWCLPSPHDRSKMAIGLFSQPTTRPLCPLSQAASCPTFISIRSLASRPATRLRAMLNTPQDKACEHTTSPTKQNPHKIKVWREDACTTLSSCPCIQSRTWLFPSESGSV